MGEDRVSIDEKLYRKLGFLKETIREMDSVLVAFSGGVDSSFLLKVAHDVLGNNAVACIGKSKTFPRSDYIRAKKFVEKYAIPSVEIETDEVKDVGFSKNPPNRCYFCKKEMFLKMDQIRRERGLTCIIYGGTLSDKSDYRPGEKAAEELNIRAPLYEARLLKEEIRELSRYLGLDTWDLPASPCLASRFPYGEEITEEKLDMVEKAEEYIRQMGVKEIRVRYHDRLARIEADPDGLEKIVQNRKAIVSYLRKLGFLYITLDLEGYRIGSLNIVLKKEE